MHATRRPLAKEDPQLVWSNRLDRRFTAQVHRLPDDRYKGVLLIFDEGRDGVLLAYVEVPLAFGAIFGPDVGDVRSWEDHVADYIDARIYRKTVAASRSALAWTVVSA